MAKTISVVGIPGSLRKGSYTRMAVATALGGAKKAGANVKLLDLSDYNLPLGDGRDKEKYPSSVKKMRKIVENADGIILGTPEYHGGMSGVLKNAIDLMGFDQFGGKMVGLVGVSGGAMGATNAMVHLRTIGRSMHAWVVPNQASVPHARDHFDKDGKLDDEALTARLEAAGEQVAKFARLHHLGKKSDFLNQWEIAQDNPGGE